MRILVVEDDPKISSFLQKGLKEESYSVDVSLDGEEAFYLIQNVQYDLILLDVMIPIINGVDLCKKIRLNNILTPIIMLTAKSSIEDKVTGLNEGANDYITKPFSFDELLARIKVQLRTKANSVNNVLQLDDLVLNTNTKEVKRGDKIIVLTSKEYSLLEFFMRNPNSIISESMINESLWDMDSETFSNIINVYIYRLRNKIDKNFDKKLLHTIRGLGYKISCQ
ncbi:MAG: response regulator transcription factor [Campylobacterales bacterium]|nr:response regulator transcription factor [Campylobacterales bacterium]